MNKFNKIFFLTFIPVILFSWSAHPVFGQSAGGSEPAVAEVIADRGGYGEIAAVPYKFGIEDKLGLGTPEGLAGRISNWIFNLAIPVAMALIIWAGIKMLTASGREQQFREGATMLKYTLIGLAVIFIGRGFVSLVQDFLGAGS